METEGSNSRAGRADTNAVLEAMEHVEVMRDLARDIEVSNVSLADELVLGIVEEEQRALNYDGKPVDPPPGATSEGGTTQAASEADPSLRHPHMYGVSPTEAQQRTDRKLAGERTPTNRITDRASLGVFANRASNFFHSVLSAIRRETLLVFILLPHIAGFLAHTEEPLRGRPDIWLVRPAYTLVSARVTSLLIYVLADAALEGAPPRIAAFPEAFRGWPSTVVVWQGFMAVGYYYQPTNGDADAWRLLRSVPWLVSVNIWMAVLALTRGLLGAYLTTRFDDLRLDHFRTRALAGVQDLRIMRILFHQAQKVHARREAEAARSRRRAAAGGSGSGWGGLARSPRTSLPFGGSTRSPRASLPHGGSQRSSVPPPAPPRSTASDSMRVPGARTVTYAEEPPVRIPSAIGSSAGAGHSEPESDSTRVGHGGDSGGLPSRRVSSVSSTSSVPMDKEIDAQLFAVGDEAPTDLGDQLDLLADAVRQGKGFVSSLAEARSRGGAYFAILLGEWRRESAASAKATRARNADSGHGRDSEEQVQAAAGPPELPAPRRAIPRARLAAWVAQMARHRGRRFRRQLDERIPTLFPGEYVTEDDFVAAVENVYRDQRFIAASVASFSVLRDHVHRILIAFWWVVMVVAGVFLVEWGLDLDEWILPLSSTAISCAALLTFLPYETIGGILYVLMVRPYDIGDRVIITQPGKGFAEGELAVVSEVGLTHTVLVSYFGERHVIMNYIVRRLAVINCHRSLNPVIQHTVYVPITTPTVKVTELIDAIREYVSRTPQDYVKLEVAFVRNANYEAGHLEIWFMIQSSIKRADDDALQQARSRLYLFVHHFMQSAGMEYLRPAQRIDARVQVKGRKGGRGRGKDAALLAAAGGVWGGERRKIRPPWVPPAGRAPLWSI